MESREQEIVRLRLAVEQTAGRKMRTNRDFELLAKSICEKTKAKISPTTLKRIWGYLDYQSAPRSSTLNVLARFIGYSDYDAFCQASDDGLLPSNPIVGRHINVQQSLVGNDEVTLTWAPDRVCRIRYLGNLQFQVIQSQNTRLQPGDYFQCSLIVEGEPLYLSNLLQNGRMATNYVCGKRGGIRFER